ncbi:MAG TPA: histidine triad nucleotide-binding protein [Ktedonobacterales bacterium]|nr:histidine triad nucleotide-binding protein [Ktedonobacterales bacterium]
MAEQHVEGCLFCGIATGKIPSTRVYEDETVIGFRDINPGAPTHVLIIPRAHIEGIDAPAARDDAILSALIHAAQQIAQQEGVAKSGYRLVWNVGPDAGQTIFHLHLHLLGGRQLAWPPG